MREQPKWKKNCFFKVAILSPLSISRLGNFLYFPFLDCVSSFPRKQEVIWEDANAWSRSPVLFCFFSSSLSSVTSKSQPCPFTAKMTLYIKHPIGKNINSKDIVKCQSQEVGKWAWSPNPPQSAEFCENLFTSSEYTFLRCLVILFESSWDKADNCYFFPGCSLL